MKRIVITRIDDPESTPWRDKNGNYTAFDPNRRFNGKTYADDYVKVPSLTVLKNFIEKGYSTRIVSASGGSPAIIVAEKLKIDVVEERIPYL